MNNSDSGAASNVTAVLQLPDGLDANLSSAMYYEGIRGADAKAIEGASGYSATKSGNTRHVMNMAPQVKFIYPGEYDYIVEQEKNEAADGVIVSDDSLYKLTVTVTARERNGLSAALGSVQKSIDNGSSWSAVPDKTQLIFTNIWSDAGPRITLNKEILDLEKGSTETLTAELANMDAGSAITWTSSDEAVAVRRRKIH